MTKNRKVALEIALGDYFTTPPTAEQYEELTLEELTEMDEDGAITIWQPFEYWDLREVFEQVESLAYNVEGQLNKKDINEKA